MVNLFVKLIIKHRKDIDDVPEELRQEVIDELARRGYDEHGNPKLKEEEESVDIPAEEPIEEV